MNPSLKHRFGSALIILTILLGTGSYHTVAAQFLDLQLELENKITATTVQELSFGTLATNSGQVEIEKGDLSMGVFTINALENQLLSLQITKPDYLIHNNPAVTDRIEIDLRVEYGYSPEEYESTYPIPDEPILVQVISQPGSSPWNTIYLFLFGTITVGDVPAGVYDNEILLNVEYI